MGQATSLGRSGRFHRRSILNTALIGFLILGGGTWFATAAAHGDLLGDTDADCDVDLDDLNNVRNHFGTSLQPGDTNGDGLVDIDDLNNVRKQVGAGALVAGPGPASGAEILITPVVTSVNLVADPTAEAIWTPNATGGALISPLQGDVFAVVDLRMTIDNVDRPDASGFGNAWFEVSFGGDVREGFGDTPIGWIPNEARVDHDGNPESLEVNVFADNHNLRHRGEPPDVLVGLWPRLFGPDGVDPRRVLGQHEPFTLGSVWVTVDSDDFGVFGSVESFVRQFSTYNEELQLGRNDGRASGGLMTIGVGEFCPIGDTDCSGDVDIDDLNNVRNNFGATGPANGSLGGDTFPYDGKVDIDDLNNVRNHFGGPDALPQPVPEPAAGAILLAALAGWRPRARQKHFCKRRHR